MLALLLVATGRLHASDTLIVPSAQYFIDIDKGLVLCNMDMVDVNASWQGTETAVVLDAVYTFVQTPVAIQTGVAYSIVHAESNAAYSLYFTALPIVSIHTPHTVPYDVKVLASFSMIEANGSHMSSLMGIEYRGGWSLSLPKKSYAIEFWNDSTGVEKSNYSLLGLNEEDDWNLQAMYNEPLRLRGKTNNDLWVSMHPIHYLDEEPLAVNGIRMRYVELFLNSEYRGLYCVGEKVKRKQLKLKKHNGNIRGELYKGQSWGASTFSELPNYSNESDYWGGFELKYPKAETEWAHIYGFVDFVMNAAQSDFYNHWADYFEADNAVDYFIFLNLLRATDNTGKNTFIAKYNSNTKYFYVPWDLDGTFGIIWDGSQQDITDDLLSNGFYNRLWYDCADNGFRSKLQSRWADLREHIITHSNIMHMYNANHIELLQNGVYEREALAWPDYIYESDQIGYMSQWLTLRLSYLDTKFNEMCIPLNVRNGNKSSGVSVYPNPASTVLNVHKQGLPPAYLEVCDLHGRVLLVQQPTGAHTKIDISELPNGIYVLKAWSGGTYSASKFMVNR